jgi:hypothetical protein
MRRISGYRAFAGHSDAVKNAFVCKTASENTRRPPPTFRNIIFLRPPRTHTKTRLRCAISQELNKNPSENFRNSYVNNFQKFFERKTTIVNLTVCWLL